MKPTVADDRTANLLTLHKTAPELPSPEQEVGSSNLPGRAIFSIHLVHPRSALALTLGTRRLLRVFGLSRLRVLIRSCVGRR
jgi:hypothetical protein